MKPEMPLSTFLRGHSRLLGVKFGVSLGFYRHIRWSPIWSEMEIVLAYEAFVAWRDVARHMLERSWRHAGSFAAGVIEGLAAVEVREL